MKWLRFDVGDVNTQTGDEIVTNEQGELITEETQQEMTTQTVAKSDETSGEAKGSVLWSIASFTLVIVFFVAILSTKKKK